MSFNTQVCTTREQSERLLALGLKKDTADMYLTKCFVGNNGTPMVFVGTTHKPSTVLFSKEDIPAWSLHRLVSMCADNNFLSSNQISLYNFSTYDRAIDLAEYLISHNHFNKQYLNQKL